MAFEARDTSAPRTGDALTSTEEITFRRNHDTEDGAPPLEVIVTKLIDGERRSFRVPRGKVIAGWPGTSKTLRAHLLAAIDNAE